MRKLGAIATLILAFGAIGFGATQPLSSAQEKTLRPAPKPDISAEDAKAFEEGLKALPDNFAARKTLIQYYFVAEMSSHDAKLEERRQEHVFWLIEHRPESEFAGSPDAEIMAIEPMGSSDGYRRGKQLWLEQANLHADKAEILKNAAKFVLLWDRPLARELLQKALLLDPGDSQASSELAQTYMLDRMMAKSPDEKAGLAREELAAGEKGLETADKERKFYQLTKLAPSAFDAGDMAKAEQYSTDLLQMAAEYKSDWNYGNAIHKGNIILGRIALRRGDIAGAKQRLLAAGETPGSPQLDSFGPSMTLAKDLLEKGERDVVLTYFQDCAKFWEMGGDDLKAWTAVVKSGGTPNFGAHLMY
jgi:hypothetical protein